MNAAAALFSTVITKTPMTLNISVDYQPGTGLVPPGGSAGSPNGGASYTYTQIKSFLASNNKTANMNALISSIPSGSTLGGNSTFALAPAAQKAFGLINPFDTTISDGGILVDHGITSANLIGVAIHEFGHCMGRSSGFAPYGFTRLTGVGMYDPNGANHSAYFSLDGGTTNLVQWGDTGDVDDFLNQSGNDPLDEFYTGATVQNFTTLNLKCFQSMGFQ